MNPIQTDILFKNQEGDQYKKQGIKEMNGKDQENEEIKRIKKKTNGVCG